MILNDTNILMHLLLKGGQNKFYYRLFLYHIFNHKIEFSSNNLIIFIRIPDVMSTNVQLKKLE